MLSLSSIAYRTSETLLFDNLTCSINAGDRLGIIGPNGAGKSTLVRIIAGELAPSSGSRTTAPGIGLGYLPQGTLDLDRGTLAEALDPASGGYFAALHELEAATAALADTDDALDRWDAAQAAFEAAGGYEVADRLRAHLARFSLPDDALQRPLRNLSGGERTRAALATMLALRPDILLLDEPTNHLDLAAQRWLAAFLENYPGAVVLVSHDRAFLEDTVNRIIAFAPGSIEVEVHAGEYADWMETRRKRDAADVEAWKRQQEKIAGLQASIDQQERSSRKIEQETIHFHYRKRAAKVARAATVRRARLERMLDSEDLVDKPEQHWGLAVAFPEPQRRARDVVTLEHVTVARGTRRILDAVDLVLHYGERLAIVGDNGAGKTTLLRVIAGAVAPDSGTRRLGRGVRIGTLAQDQEILDPRRTVLESVRDPVARPDADLRTELHRYLFGGEAVHRRVADLSFGERTRLMLALIAIPGADLLLLDEPHNHLDLDARAAFETALRAFPGAVVLVSHDRYAVKQVATRTLRVVAGGLEPVDLATDPDFAEVEIEP